MIQVLDTANQLKAEYPALRNSVPIAAPECAYPALPNYPETFWQERIARPWTPPKPLSRDLATVLSEGDCLTPILPAGRGWATVDPALTPRPGDIVLFHASQTLIDSLIREALEFDAEWLEKYAKLLDVWLKRLDYVGSCAVVACRNGAVAATYGRSLGVVVSYSRM